MTTALNSLALEQNLRPSPLIQIFWTHRIVPEARKQPKRLDPLGEIARKIAFSGRPGSSIAQASIPCDAHCSGLHVVCTKSCSHKQVSWSGE